MARSWAVSSAMRHHLPRNARRNRTTSPQSTTTDTRRGTGYAGYLRYASDALAARAGYQPPTAIPGMPRVSACPRPSRGGGALLGDGVAAVHDHVLPGYVGRARAGQPGDRGGDLLG